MQVFPPVMLMGGIFILFAQTVFARQKKSRYHHLSWRILKLRKTRKIILTLGKAEQNVLFSQRTWLNLLKYEELDLGSPYRNVILLEMIYTT